jgi:hypothetical protein
MGVLFLWMTPHLLKQKAKDRNMSMLSSGAEVLQRAFTISHWMMGKMVRIQIHLFAWEVLTELSSLLRTE